MSEDGIDEKGHDLEWSGSLAACKRCGATMSNFSNRPGKDGGRLWEQCTRQVEAAKEIVKATQQ